MSRNKMMVGVVVLSFGVSAGSAVAESAADRAELLRGVSAIAAPGVPGPVCVVGPDAFAVVVCRSGGADAAVVAAGKAGPGRLVAFGHNGYQQQDALAAADTGRLALNAVRWSGGAESPPTAVIGAPDLAKHLADHGIPVTRLRAGEAADAALTQAVVCVDAHQVDPRLLLRLQDHLAGGGGIVTFATGWGWVQLNPGKAINRDFRGNALLALAGLAFSDALSQTTAEAGFAAAREPGAYLHAGAALDALLEHAAERCELSAEQQRQIAAIITMAARAVNAADVHFRPRLEDLLDRPDAPIIPSPSQPVGENQGLQRLLVTLQTQRLRATPAQQVRAHPAADVFPGAVPPDAPRQTQTVRIDTAVPRWHSTGLYAAPGEVVTVSVPEAAAARGLVLRIGVHTDAIWSRPQWWRLPEITRSFPLNDPRTEGACALGGLILLEVPRGCDLGAIEAVIEGGIAAPRYVHNVTDADLWRTTLRHLPAPWAEIGSDKVIISVPSEHVRELEDPAELMTFWDSVLDACADLAGRDRNRTSPERYVSDVQISAGYMHAGYPIMTFLDAAPRFVDVATLRRRGDWGMFHEMGHNHQGADWTFAGTGEVTVNLFTLYVLETVCPGAPLHEAIGPRNMTRRIRRHVLENGSDFEAWKNDPFTGLIMYIQLQRAFGWDAYKRVFAEYRDLPAQQRPRNDDEKRDQWLVRMSRTVGHDLGPFFQAWGVPTSEAARQSIGDLRGWMPEGFPPAP